MSARRIFALLAVAVLTAACSSDSSTSTPSASPTGATGTTVSVTEKDFSIALASSTVPAGSVTFNVRNDGPSVHEFVVFKTDLAEGSLPMVADGTIVDEEGAGVTAVDEIEDIESGSTKSLTVTLAAGNYVAICNLSGHYKLGMHAKLVVS